MEIDQLPQVSDVLRSFIRDTRDVVPKDQHRGGLIAVAADFLDIDHRAIRDPSDSVEPSSAFALNFLRSFALSA